MKKELTLNYDRKGLTNLLNRLDNGPFYPVYCTDDGFWYLFRYKEPADAFKLGGEGGIWDYDTYCTEENIVMSFEGKTPRSIDLSFTLPSGYNFRYGTTGNNIEYTFATIDSNLVLIREGVYATYKFSVNGNTFTNSDSYDFAESGDTTSVSYNIDNYITEAGTYTIYVTLVGKETNTRVTKAITVNVRQIEIESDFDISIIRDQNDSFNINFKAKAIGDRYVNVYIDTNLVVKNYCIPASDVTNSTFYNYEVHAIDIGTGKHIILMYAYIDVNGTEYRSETLYYEFIVLPYAGSHIIIADTLDANEMYLGKEMTISTELYVGYYLPWAYYTELESAKDRTVNIAWKARKVGTTDTYMLLLSLTASMYLADYNQKTDDLLIVATEYGDFILEAWRVNDLGINVYDSPLGSWNLHVIKNTTGIAEKPNYACKYSAKARYNTQTEATKTIWEYLNSSAPSEMFVEGVTIDNVLVTQSKTFNAVFNNVNWDDRSGWKEQSYLQLTGNATATLNCKPFAHNPNTYGCTFEIEFDTESVYDEDTPIITVGERLVITPTTATLKSAANNPTSIKTNFAKGNRTKIAFIIENNLSDNPNKRLVSIMVNGVLDRTAIYGATESFNSTDVIKIGSALATTKIYMIRCYAFAVDYLDELYNYIIDSDTTSTLVTNNDIYISGTNKISVEKVKAKIPCACITGNISNIIRNKNKLEINIPKFAWTNPNDPERNFTATNLTIRNHGLSSLGYAIPSFKFWLNKKGKNTVVKDASGLILSTGRWAMREGSMPLKKYVLQAFYVDSSLSKSGALLQIINDSYKEVVIDNKHVLNTPPMDFIEGTGDNSYKGQMVLSSNNTYTLESEVPDFKYPLRHTPDSIPCCVFYQNDEESEWNFLGQFVLMDDKKSDFLYGERSIYDRDGDPFVFYSDEKYNKIWDNKNVTRFELLDNLASDDRLMFKGVGDDYNTLLSGYEGISDDADYEKDSYTFGWQHSFELIYPDPDDLTVGELKSLGNKLKQLLYWFGECYDEYKNSKTFTKFDNEIELHLNLYSFAAYYLICLDNGAFDSTVRNMQLITWDPAKSESTGTGTDAIWYAMWWDIDVQDGTINSGVLVYPPKIDFDTYSESREEYAFPGANNTSFLWQALRQNEKFNSLLTPLKNALFTAGYDCAHILDKQENDFAFRYNECLYNESELYKYVQQYLNYSAPMYLDFLQGRGEMYRRYWLQTNMEYLDAKLCAGAYTGNSVYVRVSRGNETDTTPVYTILTYGSSTYAGYGQSGRVVEKVQAKKLGDTYSIDMTLGTLSNPYYIYGCASVIKADFSLVAPWISLITLDGFVSDSGNVIIEELDLGLTVDDIKNGKTNKILTSIDNLELLTSLKKLYIQGYASSEMTTLKLEGLYNLEEIYLGGTQINSVALPSNTNLKVQLPTTLEGISMNNISLNSLEFMDSTMTVVDIPTTISKISLIGMGNQEIVKTLIFTWLHNIDKSIENEDNWNAYSLECTNISWENVSYEDLMLLAKIPKASRKILYGAVWLNTTGRTLSSYEASAITEKFGENALNGTGDFTVYLSEGFLLNVKSGVYETKEDYIEVLAGNSIQLEAIAFNSEGIDNTAAYVYFYEYGDNMSLMVPIGSEATINNLLTITSTGKITTIENTGSDFTVTISVSTLGSSTSSSITIKVKRRSYPNDLIINSPLKVSLVQGKDRIITNDYYLYSLSYVPEDFTGTITNIQWTLYNTVTEESVSDYIQIKETDAEKGTTILQLVNSPSEIIYVTLKSEVFTKGSTGALSQEKFLMLLAMTIVLTAKSNPALYIVLWSILSNSKIETDTQKNQISSINLTECSEADLTTVSSLFVQLLTSFYSTPSETEYYIPNYLTSCEKLILDGAINLAENLDVSKMENLKELSTKNTAIPYVEFKDKQQITYLSLGTPTTLELPNLVYLKKGESYNYLNDLNLSTTYTKYTNPKADQTNLKYEYIPEVSTTKLSDDVLAFAASLDITDTLNTKITLDPDLIEYINKWKYLILSVCDTDKIGYIESVNHAYTNIDISETGHLGFKTKITGNRKELNRDCNKYLFTSSTNLFYCGYRYSYSNKAISTPRFTGPTVNIKTTINISYNYLGSGKVEYNDSVNNTLNTAATFDYCAINSLKVFNSDSEYQNSLSFLYISNEANEVCKLVPYYNGIEFGLLDLISKNFYVNLNCKGYFMYVNPDIDYQTTNIETISGIDTFKRYIPTFGLSNGESFSIQDISNLENYNIILGNERNGAGKLLVDVLKYKNLLLGKVNDIQIEYSLITTSEEQDERGESSDIGATTSKTTNYIKKSNTYVQKLKLEAIATNNSQEFDSSCTMKILTRDEINSITSESSTTLKNKINEAFAQLDYINEDSDKWIGIGTTELLNFVNSEGQALVYLNDLGELKVNDSNKTYANAIVQITANSDTNYIKFIGILVFNTRFDYIYHELNTKGITNIYNLLLGDYKTLIIKGINKESYFIPTYIGTTFTTNIASDINDEVSVEYKYILAYWNANFAQWGAKDTPNVYNSYYSLNTYSDAPNLVYKDSDGYIKTAIIFNNGTNHWANLLPANYTNTTMAHLSFKNALIKTADDSNFIANSIPIEESEKDLYFGGPYKIAIGKLHYNTLIINNGLYKLYLIPVEDNTFLDLVNNSFYTVTGKYYDD